MEFSGISHFISSIFDAPDRRNICVVAELNQAIRHINRRSTKHSEAIVTRDDENARRFLRRVDSVAVYGNASTRFSDGNEF
jgi:glutamate-5-semialdehyde dehydrogenase